MSHASPRRTGENFQDTRYRKNYMLRYSKLVKMQKTHYNKWVDVSKELKLLQPHIERMTK
jgi:hypothetical protein